MDEARFSTPLRDRFVAGAGSAAVVALTGWALLLNPGGGATRAVEEPTTLLALRPSPPPPVRPVERHRATRTVRAAGPPNLRNQATPVVAPPPVVPLAPPPVVIAPRPGVGLAANTGAADRPGSGEGAGGQGNGTGGGGQGDGDGDTPPELRRGRLAYGDLPPDLRAAGTGGSVGVRYRVEVNGRVSGCTITRSSGNAELDALTCSLIERRFRYDPARDADRRPFAASIVDETHSWIVDRSQWPGEAR